MSFMACLGVKDTAASKAFYEKLGFAVDSGPAGGDDDLHMLLFQGHMCAMLYRAQQLGAWLPDLAETPIGFSGMFYLSVEGYDAVHDRFASQIDIIKDTVTDHNGVREFYFRDPDGYVIGVNDAAALRVSATVGQYAE